MFPKISSTIVAYASYNQRLVDGEFSTTKFLSICSRKIKIGSVLTELQFTTVVFRSDWNSDFCHLGLVLLILKYADWRLGLESPWVRRYTASPLSVAAIPLRLKHHWKVDDWGASLVWHWPNIGCKQTKWYAALGGSVVRALVLCVSILLAEIGGFLGVRDTRNQAMTCVVHPTLPKPKRTLCTRTNCRSVVFPITRPFALVNSQF